MINYVYEALERKTYLYIFILDKNNIEGPRPTLENYVDIYFSNFLNFNITEICNLL